MKFQKPPFSIENQIARLKERGLSIPNEKEAAHYLKTISYYRLSVYALFFQVLNDENHKFKTDVTFNDILDLYTFDRELRLLVNDAIERIEIAFRTLIVNIISQKLENSHWYLDPEAYIKDNYFRPYKFIAKIENECEKSKEVFIESYQKKYTNPQLPPVWMIMELLTMGDLAVLFKHLNLKNQTIKNARYDISKSLGVPKPEILENWMKCIQLLRNICAHHGRLWNRKLTFTIQEIRNQHILWHQEPILNKRSVYSYLVVIQYLMKKINSESNWNERLKTLLIKYPSIQTEHMGFTQNWQNEDLWC